MPVDEGFEAAAGAHRAELAVVSDDDQLGAGRFGGGKQAEHGGVVGHARLVTDNHGAAIEVDLFVVETPQQGGDGSGLLDACLGA